jgi:hypothetical protein
MGFRQMPDQVIPKEWAPDAQTSRYRDSARLIQQFNAVGRLHTRVTPAAALAIAECAPVPAWVRYAVGGVAAGIWLAVAGASWWIRHKAQRMQDVAPPDVKIRPPKQEQAA